MCGIVGIWQLDEKPIDSEELQRFTDSLMHRGPDGGGNFIDGSLGLGHRRLSIIDLTENGKQPMSYGQQRYWITFNGEIYNFIELRKELESLGHVFATDSDTEIILAAYIQWGKNCLHKFNGMWAFAIWDKAEKKLFLARDRFGVKPLHYSFEANKHFIFSSETISFKYLKNFTREIDTENLHKAMLRPDYIEAAGKTIYKNIQQLLPGHCIELTQNKPLLINNWWNTSEHLVQVPQKYEDQVEEFRALFEDACKLRMRSDVPMASALSGGLDSSSVYCTLHKIKSRETEVIRSPKNWQKAFVATFPNTTVDERKYAEEVVQYVKGQAEYIIPDDSHLLPELIKATQMLDSIIATPITSISDVYKAMRADNVIVSMDGHGVDEMMYGYTSHVQEAFWQKINAKEYAAAKEYAHILSGMSPNYNMDALRKHYEKPSLLDRVKNKLFNKNVVSTAPTNENWMGEGHAFPALNIFPTPSKGLEKMLFNDFHYHSLPINLRDFDRAAMQHGIEIRMPFMDYRLVSYVFSLPTESKLGGGFTKRILRDAMKGYLPESIRTRTLKIGIGAPMVEWFSGPLKQYICDTVHSNTFLKSDYWNGAKIVNFVDDKYAQNNWDKGTCQKVWAILNANIIINNGR